MISLMLIVSAGLFGFVNIIWLVAVKIPYSSYASKWQDYNTVSSADRETTPFIEAVLGENNSYGIDTEKYENMGIEIRELDYLQNNGVIVIYSDKTASFFEDEIIYTDEKSTEGIYPRLTVRQSKRTDGYGNKLKKTGYKFSVGFEGLTDKDDNDIFFYIDENMNLILPDSEEYADEIWKYYDENFKHYYDSDVAVEKAKEYLKEYAETHNPMREKLYKQYYEDIRVMMIVLYEAFGIGNVKA